METKASYPVTHSEAEWRKILTPEQYAVLRGHGTERPGSCALDYEKRAGKFTCAGCEQELFISGKKFDSRTGWPSFNDPVPGAVETEIDRSLGMARTEVHCSQCGGHLGHVFEDGPPPTGLRYCINGVAMNFRPDSEIGNKMTKIHYRVVQHDGGWAYKLGDVFSEPFATHDLAMKVARRVAAEQHVPGETRYIEYQDAAGEWKTELAEGGDRPDADVLG